MTDVIDLAAAREKRDGPDPEFVHFDAYGRKVFDFGYEFDFEGGVYAETIRAYDEDEARRKLAAMGPNLRYLGQIMGMIPA